MLRVDALRAIYPELSRCIVVTNMGAAPAELFSLGHRPGFFYLWHSMGLASSVGLGVALSRPELQVVVVDGDGSLLDHLMLLYGGGISNSDRHTHGPLPTVLVGGGAGALKGGRHLVYPTDTPLTNLQLTLLDRLGVPVESLGDSTGQFKELSEL